MTNYRFVTRWRFEAPVEKVWDEIYHPERWPQWWKAVKAVDLVRQGDAQGLGTVRRYTWRGALPYTLSFDMRTSKVEFLSRLEGVATGELSGNGCWMFSVEKTATLVRYDWEVETTKAWMRILSPVARPLFEWNHDTVMRWGLDGLNRRLGH